MRSRSSSGSVRCSAGSVQGRAGQDGAEHVGDSVRGEARRGGTVHGGAGRGFDVPTSCLTSVSCVARSRSHALPSLVLMRRQASHCTRTGLAWVSQVPMRCNKKGAEKVKQNGKAGGEGQGQGGEKKGEPSEPVRSRGSGVMRQRVESEASCTRLFHFPYHCSVLGFFILRSVLLRMRRTRTSQSCLTA